MIIVSDDCDDVAITRKQQYIIPSVQLQVGSMKSMAMEARRESAKAMSKKAAAKCKIINVKKLLVFRLN
jgi:hypothetical protein